MKAGAVKFLTKPFRDQQLLDAIQQAVDQDRTARHQPAELAELRRRYESLTQREREVMTLVVKGLLNKQVAAELRTSEATVKAHRAQLMHKMEGGVRRAISEDRGKARFPPPWALASPYQSLSRITNVDLSSPRLASYGLLVLIRN
jgi:DNA-binding CsgD family transcriptional regulator